MKKIFLFAGPPLRRPCRIADGPGDACAFCECAAETAEVEGAGGILAGGEASDDAGVRLLVRLGGGGESETVGLRGGLGARVAE